MDFTYQSGFGNHFSTEAYPKSLPMHQNNPQKVPFGLFAEQHSGTAFTCPRSMNLRSWLYRLHPSVASLPDLTAYPTPKWITTPHKDELTKTPGPLRWDPLPKEEQGGTFIESLRTVVLSGSPELGSGCAVHLFHATQSMEKDYLSNQDGEFLIVPYEGHLVLRTEYGQLRVSPQEIATIPKGTRFQVRLEGPHAAGYILENFGLPMTLPPRGVVGANGMANERDFLYPMARFEDLAGTFRMFIRHQGTTYMGLLKASPLDVVAWHGNLAPYKYDLRNYNTLGTISYDHPDPSLFTVLTSPGIHPGVANVDFVLFAPRWLVGEKTFRPPYFHRNVMSEYMGLIEGVYDGKTAGGFVPGGGSLHRGYDPHGPDTQTYLKATHEDLKPAKIENSLAFMFESSCMFSPTTWAYQSSTRQKDYSKTWHGFKRSSLDLSAQEAQTYS